MSSSIRIEKAPTTETRSLPFLPRIGLVVDFGGCRLSYRKVPLLETLWNMRKHKKGLIETTKTMLGEVQLSRFQDAARQGASE